jgi:hypothetical protein
MPGFVKLSSSFGRAQGFSLLATSCNPVRTRPTLPDAPPVHARDQAQKCTDNPVRRCPGLIHEPWHGLCRHSPAGDFRAQFDTQRRRAIILRSRGVVRSSAAWWLLTEPGTGHNGERDLLIPCHLTVLPAYRFIESAPASSY